MTPEEAAGILVGTIWHAADPRFPDLACVPCMPVGGGMAYVFEPIGKGVPRLTVCPPQGWLHTITSCPHPPAIYAGFATFPRPEPES